MTEAWMIVTVFLFILVYDSEFVFSASFNINTLLYSSKKKKTQYLFDSTVLRGFCSWMGSYGVSIWLVDFNGDF